MKVVIRDEKPVVQDLPKGYKILLFGQIYHHLFLIAYTQENDPLPGCFELSHAKIGIGEENKDITEIYEVFHGHKYVEGGGMLETRKGVVGFSTTDKNAFIELRPFEKVFIIT